MHKAGFRAVAGAIAVGGMLASAVPATAADKVARERVIGVEGVAKGNADRRVEVLVRVPAGVSARAAGDRALAAQGATRAAAPQAARYAFTGRGGTFCRCGRATTAPARRSPPRRRR